MTSTSLLVIGILAVLSFYSWSCILRKRAELKRADRSLGRVRAEVTRAPSTAHAEAWCTRQEDAMCRGMILRAAEMSQELAANRLPAGGIRPADLEMLRMIMDEEVDVERGRLSGGLTALAVVATVSPLLGLLGTVTGVMRTFIGIQASGAASIAAVAPGVSEALLTTVVGLVVAIPAAVAHQIYSARLEEIEGTLAGLATTLVHTTTRELRA
jgi:biopolymer transport protein TolQ